MSPSKILLFGEYTILNGSDALAVPYDILFGEFDFINSNNEKTLESNRQLELLSEFLKNNTNLIHIIDTDKFKVDINQGLFFNSNIKEQYGLGSSAAISAEILRMYSNWKSTDIYKTKEILSQIETFYHGQSSGIDALVSYLKSPIWIKDKNLVVIADFSFSKLSLFGTFLIDTQINSKTKNHVEDYRRRYNDDRIFKKQIEKTLIPAVNNTIEYFLNENTEMFFKEIERINHIQTTIFKKLIPERNLKNALYGLSNQLFYLKLCGSGGGGFLLGFTHDSVNTKKYFLSENIKIQFI
jgi:mevalonate kinase